MLGPVALHARRTGAHLIEDMLLGDGFANSTVVRDVHDAFDGVVCGDDTTEIEIGI